MLNGNFVLKLRGNLILRIEEYQDISDSEEEEDEE